MIHVGSATELLNAVARFIEQETDASAEGMIHRTGREAYMFIRIGDEDFELAINEA